MLCAPPVYSIFLLNYKTFAAYPQTQRHPRRTRPTSFARAASAAGILASCTAAVVRRPFCTFCFSSIICLIFAQKKIIQIFLPKKSGLYMEAARMRNGTLRLFRTLAAAISAFDLSRSNLHNTGIRENGLDVIERCLSRILLSP